MSREEQARRFIKRLDEPAKRWKFSMGDVRERERWPEYMKAYEDVVQNTSTPDAPWLVVPADRKWFARLIVAGAVLDALEQLKLHPPKVSRGHERELAEIRAALARELGEDEAGQGGGRKKR